MTDPAPLLEVRHVSKHYTVPGKAPVRAVNDVSLVVAKGETVGLVGESGCGKSTLCRVVMGLMAPTSGEVLLQGETISNLPYGRTRLIKRRMQMIFQDPYSSLNPRRRIGTIIEEPLAVHGLGTNADRHARIAELLTRTGLPADVARRYPHELSGGQRQRVGIARALALSPELIICDEPVSALDVSVQAQVINLLMHLQADLGLSYLFISHDLAVVSYVADRIVVMYLGRIVEVSDPARIWKAPLHPYTAALLAAHPTVDAPTLLPSQHVAADLAPGVAGPGGCRFRQRCPYAVALCDTQDPPLRQLPDGRSVACHRVELSAEHVVTPMSASHPVTIR